MTIMGCGSADPIDRAMAQAQVLADVVCQCPPLAGTTNEAACRERVMTYSFTEAEESCVRRVYSAHEAEMRPVIDCQYNAQVELTECMRPLAESCSGDSTAAAACGTEFSNANDGCPTPSEQAMAELNACFASRT
jgi:hypothetical protein